jgi:hypothetical protein
MRLLMRRSGGADPSRLMAGGGALRGKHAGGHQRPKETQREKKARRKGKRR